MVKQGVGSWSVPRMLLSLLVRPWLCNEPAKQESKNKNSLWKDGSVQSYERMLLCCSLWTVSFLLITWRKLKLQIRIIFRIWNFMSMTWFKNSKKAFPRTHVELDRASVQSVSNSYVVVCMGPCFWHLIFRFIAMLYCVLVKDSWVKFTVSVASDVRSKI